MAEVTVIGAGPAGLAAAAALQRRGLETLVVDRADAVGASWRSQYDSLRLNTVRWISHLPGLRLPNRFGAWVARDDFVAYLEDYTRRHRLRMRLSTNVQSVERREQRWLLTTSDETLETSAVVVATGYCRSPLIPDWPGREHYTGELLHSSQYRNAEPYAGRDVLVIGAGNSGAEIAGELAASGAKRTRLAVRTLPHVVPRTVFGVPTILVSVLTRRLPVVVGDTVMRWLQSSKIGDLGPYGLPRPSAPISRQFELGDVVPISDLGPFVAGVRTGKIEIVAPAVAFDGASVKLADGTRVKPDAVVAATGYHLGLEQLVGHLGVLGEDGRPGVHGPATHPAAPRLYFIGFTNPLSGNLRELRLDARRIASREATTKTRRRKWGIWRHPRLSAGRAGREPSQVRAGS